MWKNHSEIVKKCHSFHNKSSLSTVAAPEIFVVGIEGAKCDSEGAKIQKFACDGWFWPFFSSDGGCKWGEELSDGGGECPSLMPPLTLWIHSLKVKFYSFRVKSFSLELFTLLHTGKGLTPYQKEQIKPLWIFIVEAISSSHYAYIQNKVQWHFGFGSYWSLNSDWSVSFPVGYPWCSHGILMMGP